MESKKKYTSDDLKKALQDIRDNDIAQRSASRIYKIPRTTLWNNIHGKVEKNKPGPSPYLTWEGEKKIEEWIENSCAIGFPVKKCRLLCTVQKIVQDSRIKVPFPNGRPTDCWYNLFLQRHQNIRERVLEGISKGRAVVTKESISCWFDNLKLHLKERNALDILIDPSRIYNGDETSFNLCPKTGKVLCPKAWKNVYEINVGNDKETITVLIFIAANGKLVTPMVVYPYIRLPQPVAESVPENWIIGKSESGWMQSQVFYEYMANGFNQWLTDNDIKKPILCLVDGHKSHLTMHLSQFCDDNGIILYSLLPNSTHILQPADLSIFKSLKSNWKNTVMEWQSDNFDKTLTKELFAPLLFVTLTKNSIEEAIKNGFRAAGIYPFDKEAVDYTRCVKNNMENLKEKISKKSMDNTTSLNLLLSMLDKVKSPLNDEGIDVEIVKSVIKKFYLNNEGDINSEHDLMLDDAIDKSKEMDLPQDLNTNKYAEIDENVDNNSEPDLMFHEIDINYFQDIEEREISMTQDLNTNEYAEIDDNKDDNIAEPYLILCDTNDINCFQDVEEQEIALTQDLSTKEYAEIVMPDGSITKVPIIDLVEDDEEACKNSSMFKCVETSILNDINVMDLDFILEEDFLNQDTMNIGTDDVHQICTPATPSPQFIEEGPSCSKAPATHVPCLSKNKSLDILSDINVMDLDFMLEEDFLNQDTMNIVTDDLQICTPATSNPQIIDEGPSCSKSPATHVPCVSKNKILDAAFEKHLFYPSPIRKKKAQPKVKLPNAISSAQWRQHFKDKEDLKIIKDDEIKERKELRLKKQVEKREASALKRTKREVKKTCNKLIEEVKALDGPSAKKVKKE
ncbi:hypothetical protein TKK_0001791 [Trichogramma kaykai]|uniref:HTH CENPB-type domain-containing protein n=1 Tax=Trichogramma kaykai TaxID=54128 RepID=A0ABD2XFC1_9HYME